MESHLFIIALYSYKYIEIYNIKLNSIPLTEILTYQSF